MRANDAWSQGAFAYPVPAWQDPGRGLGGIVFRGQLPMVPGDIEPIPDRWPQLRLVVLDCLFFPHAEVVMKRQADGLSSIANDMPAEESPHEAGFGGLAWYLGYG